MTRHDPVFSLPGGQTVICAYCNIEIGSDRPVQTEAICWRCWYRMYGKDQAVREWKARRWWRRLVP